MISATTRRGMSARAAALLVASAALLAGPALAAPAAPAAHLERPKFHKNELPLQVSVIYPEARGRASVGAKGVTYHRASGATQPGTLYYPQSYWRDGYPLIEVGEAAVFKVRVVNRGRRPLRDLQIVATHESLDFFGKDGEDLPGCDAMAWSIPKLAAGQSWEGVARFTLPRRVTPGLAQTHVQIQQHGGRGAARLLHDAPQAGVFCPPEPSITTASL